MPTLTAWLRDLGLERYIDALAAQDIDLEVVPELSDADLERLGLSLGHRRRFLAAAARLREAAAPVRAAAPPAQADDVERRQVTVLFADLAGSTALSRALDPEDLRNLLARYRAACADIVVRHDGYVAQYLGDGVMAYFGVPRALEDAAERAVRAALGIAREVSRIARPDGTPLATRVGIASGLVVAEVAMTGGEQTVVGDTPNLAARLQALAAPGQVLVGDATRRLTGAFFDHALHGEHALKGFDTPQRVWAVLGERVLPSRYAGARAGAPLPMFGREREFAYALDSWQRARAGNGHLVRVCGDAGLGKSRLFEALAEHAQADGAHVLRCQCSPYHRNSALHPFAQLLRHALALRPEHDGAEKLARLDGLLERIGRAGRTGHVLTADLLELETAQTLSSMELTPAQRKNETLAIVEAFVAAEAAPAPALLLVEDAHWIDPTSAALIERLLARIDRLRLLALVSHRPEWAPSWQRHANSSAIECRPLGRETCAELVRAVAARHALDDAQVREIVARSDGVPLYAEELTRAMIDLQAGTDAEVPATLRDSLMARLDRLGEAKTVAQVAAVIGREFDISTLAAVSGVAAGALEAALEKLRQSGLVALADGDGEGDVYAFHHALVQEEAYESLAKARRIDLHRRIAAWLAAEPAREAASELIAHHHARAGDAAAACEAWLAAAEHARQRTAFAESIAHLEAALAEAGRVADAETSARLTLATQLRLGATIVMQRGPLADPAAAVLAEARELAASRSAGAEQFQATWGLYLHAASNLRFDIARRYGDELMAIGERLADPDLHMEAMHHRWGYAWFTGLVPGMLEHTLKPIEDYDAAHHHRFAHVFGGHDLGVCAHCVRGMALAMAGRGRETAACVDGGVALAESLEHPLSLAFALGNAGIGHWLACDFERAGEAAERLVAIGDRYDLVPQRALGAFVAALVRGRCGNAAQGADEAARHYDATRTQGFLGMFPAATMAEALLRCGRHDAAFELANRALEGLPSAETGIFVPELWRLRAEARAMSDGDHEHEVEHDLRTALRIASVQRAEVFRLRAALALGRLLHDRGRIGEAHELVRAQAAATDLDPALDEQRALHALAVEIGK